MANACFHELFNHPDRLNTTPGSDRHAIHCGGGATEIKLPLQGPILEKPVDKPGMEDVSRTGRVDYRNPISGGVM